MSFTLLEGKKGVVFGLANNRSIAWGIAKTLRDHGAELAFSYPSESIKKRVIPFAKELGSEIVIECNVGKEGSVESFFKELGDYWSEIDFVVHSVAFSDKNELKGRYLDLSHDNFINSMIISCYSFTEIMKYASTMMKNGGSAITMTYDGSNRVVPHYNVMGVCKAALESSVRYLAEDLGKDNIRINSISAGPIKTLAASGIGDFSYILNWSEKNSPLRRNVTIDEVGKSALYLISDLSSGVTGSNLMVDSGFHTVGMASPESVLKLGKD